MNDDQIRSELERRAGSAASAPDWTKRSLLPAVWREVDARPQPVVTSRWPSFAGAAALVVALLILVVAVPRLAPQPPSASASPADTVVLTTANFASRLAAGSLEGRTVLVDGRITADPALVGYCVPAHHCYFGALEGTAPAVTVSVMDVATVQEDANASMRGIDTWTWWRAFRAPVQGILLLSVDATGAVEYVGQVVMNGDRLTWSPGEVNAELDINAQDLDEVVLVDGWLYEGARLLCAAPHAGERDFSLPGRYCGNTFLLNSASTDDASRVQVQPGAYESAVNPDNEEPLEPRQGTYALAPRLEGWCGGAQPPCWQWNVVARVDDAPTPEPTPPPTPPIAPSPSPSGSTPAVGTDRAKAGGAAFELTLTADRTEYTAGEPIDVSSSLRSETDVTVSCLSRPSISLVQLDGDIEFAPGPFIQVCRGEEQLHGGEELVTGFLPAVWAEATPNPLDPYIRDGQLYLPPGTYRFSAHSSFSVGALDQLGQQLVRLETAVVIHVAPEDAPTEPGTRTIGCEGSQTLGDPGIALIDHSGQVSGCFVEEAQSVVDAGPLELTSTDQPTRLAATWGVNLFCPSDDQLEFWGPLDESVGTADYVMQLVRVRSQTLEVPGDACDVVTFRTVEIEFTDPISPRDILGLAVDKSIADNTVSASSSEGSFQLKLSAPAVSPANQPIDVSSSLTYQGTGQVTLSGWWKPDFAFASLTDGPSLPSYGHTLLCPDAEIQLRPSEPVLGSLDGGMEVTPEDPNYAYRIQYAYDGKFRLPDGSYLIYTGVGFDVGPDCTGDHVQLRTAIVIRVGLESVVQPTETTSTAADCSETFLLLDRTGLVESCSEWTPEPGESGVSQGPDASSVFIAWTYSYCRGAPFARFEQAGDRYVFELGHLVTLPTVWPSCEPVTRTVGIAVRFTQPLDVSLIDVDLR